MERVASAFSLSQAFTPGLVSIRAATVLGHDLQRVSLESRMIEEKGDWLPALI
jgi:hypothetical protein